MASQEYISYLYEAQAELVLQRNNLVELGARKAWEFFPNVNADIKAKTAIIENMLNFYEPPRKKRSSSRWQRLTKLDSADMINDMEDLVTITFTAVSTILNEVEMMIDRHIPSTSPFQFSKMQERSTSVHWGPSQTVLFNRSHAPASLTRTEGPKHRETEVFSSLPFQSFMGCANAHLPHLPNPLRLC